MINEEDLKKTKYFRMSIYSLNEEKNLLLLAQTFQVRLNHGCASRDLDSICFCVILNNNIKKKSQRIFEFGFILSNKSALKIHDYLCS